MHISASTSSLTHVQRFASSRNTPATEQPLAANQGAAEVKPSPRMQVKMPLAPGTGFQAQAIGQGDALMRTLYGEAYDPARRMISGPAFRDKVDRETADLNQQLSAALSSAGVSHTGAIAFHVNEKGEFEVKGEHPDKERIHAMLDADPELTRKLRGNLHRQQEEAHFKVEAEHAERFKEAKSRAEIYTAWEAAVMGHEKVARLTDLTFSGGRLELSKPA